jgi:hypothetical protein
VCGQTLNTDTSDSECFDIESGNEEVEDRPWRPSHVVFGKSSVKQEQIKAMKGRYFRDISIVRARGDITIPLPKDNEVVVPTTHGTLASGGKLDIWLVETNGLRLDTTLLCASMLLLIGLLLQ